MGLLLAVPVRMKAASSRLLNRVSVAWRTAVNSSIMEVNVRELAWL